MNAVHPIKGCIIEVMTDKATPPWPVEARPTPGVTIEAAPAGNGSVRAYRIRIEKGARTEPHPAQVGHFFLVISGQGWVRDRDELPTVLHPGRGTYIARGDVHATGSDHGMTAVVVQAADFTAREKRA